MAEAYRYLTRKRIKVSDVREGVDAVTGILDLLGLQLADDTIDAITNIGMYAYSMANSPYLPSRENNRGMLAIEVVGYGTVALTELLPFIKDVSPGYSIASRIFDWLYSRRKS